MSKQDLGAIPFSKANAQKCLCGNCPVQTKSKCSQELASKMWGLAEDAVLPASQIPGLYCSSGKATCTDLDPNQKCICPSCPIYEECSLSVATPAAYFCVKGQGEFVPRR
ncbi:MAG: DUF2769 domain-containing protein [Chloroflexota bacterium]